MLRQLRPRDEGSGGSSGVVLNMTLSGDGVWNAIYSIRTFVGENQQSLMLSVDTGSSDIWLASNTCSTSECSSAHTTLYDPSAAQQTGDSLNLTYLQGSASGPIVWDTFQLGPYIIPSQALVAAQEVSNEPLSSDFVGLLGLALPPNSQIARIIPPTESNAPDGATMQQNLFGLTPVDTAPEQRFFGISLERPGSSRIASLLSIGRHPSDLVSGFDPSDVAFIDLIASNVGDTYWRVPITSITAWVNSEARPITLGNSKAISSLNTPVAIVDTGGSVILTTRDIANGIYGAWGIGPGQDGNYYVPCTTPLNMTIGLGQHPPIPLHPLDITAPPPFSSASSNPTTCLGVIQASDSLGTLTDMVLGVPFMRNVYTVLSSSSSSNASSPSPQGSNFPRLGLLSLTDPTTALAEFHSVRVLGQPLDPSVNQPTHEQPVTVGKKLSVGITVLVGIVGFFVACGVLFAIRWWILRRRFKKADGTEDTLGWGQKKQSRDGEPDEDTLRTQKWEEGKKKGLFYAESSTGSDFTRVDQAWVLDERAARQKKEDDNAHAQLRPRSQSPIGSLGSDADVGHASHNVKQIMSDVDGWGALPQALHVRTASEMAVDSTGVSAVPLLDEGENSPWASDSSPSVPPMSSHRRSASLASVSFSGDLGMAGVGTRGSVAGSGKRVPRSREARTASGGSISSLGTSRTFSAEVGQVLQQVDVPWPTEPEQG
ncbi:acid protease [Ramaria rubella]|nr:acid protease [Ramaria rubella]